MTGRWKPPKEQRTDADACAGRGTLPKSWRTPWTTALREDFVAAVKTYKPEIGNAELKAWIMRFRAGRREKRGLRHTLLASLTSSEKDSTSLSIAGVDLFGFAIPNQYTSAPRAVSRTFQKSSCVRLPALENRSLRGGPHKPFA